MGLGLSFGLNLRASQPAAGGGGNSIPANALTLNGQVLTLNGQTLTLGA